MRVVVDVNSSTKVKKRAQILLEKAKSIHWISIRVVVMVVVVVVVTTKRNKYTNQ